MIFHCPPTTNRLDTVSFELLSRARKRLLLVISDNVLRYETFDFTRVLFQLLDHGKKYCKNKICLEQGWEKEKVIEVREVDFSLMPCSEFNKNSSLRSNGKLCSFLFF